MLTNVIQDFATFLLEEDAANQVVDFNFDITNRVRNIDDIKSINDKTIKIPVPRKGCVIGLKEPSTFPSRTKVLDIYLLKEHIYTDKLLIHQPSLDEIGHIYTKYGGIIDIAHLRDHADLTRYIATQLVDKFKPGGEISLGIDIDPYRENTGERVIKIHRQGSEPSAFQLARIAAVIAYDVAIWHEIATFKTWQDYSTFSPEDNYSNLLGCYVGFLACLNPYSNYEDAVTNIIFRKISQLYPQSIRISEQIIDYLNNKWYQYSDDGVDSGEKIAEIIKILLYLKLKRRNCITGYNENLIDRIRPNFYVSPWLVTDASRNLTSEIKAAVIPNPPSYQRVGINIPQVDENNIPLRQYYSFEIQNATNKDQSIFNNHLDSKGTLDSTKFGQVVENIRMSYKYEYGLETDSPAIDH
jgi:hypothetical protein